MSRYTTELRITRAVQLPDPVRVARCRRAPELGPKILFFSGGTALRETCRSLVLSTHNSIHLITPFDSGGSSAVLREAFHVLAVGDLRNRLLALADRSVRGHPEVFDLFAFRFPKTGENGELRQWLDRMIGGDDAMVAAVPDPMRKLIRNHLRFFVRKMPESFNLRGANIGNLILVGGYLNQGRHIDPVVFLFSKLVNVRGVVRPTTSHDLHLAAELESGEVVCGQHRLTGKEADPIESPVARLFLTDREASGQVASTKLRGKVRDLIVSADLICYPMGSFYSSVIANLLVGGVGQAIAEADVPKVYVPNTTPDPEQLGMSVADQVRVLFEYSSKSAATPVNATDLIHFVLVDPDVVRISEPERRAIAALGVKVVSTPLVSEESAPLIDGELLSSVLVSLAS